MRKCAYLLLFLLLSLWNIVVINHIFNCKFQRNFNPKFFKKGILPNNVYENILVNFSAFCRSIDYTQYKEICQNNDYSLNIYKVFFLLQHQSSIKLTETLATRILITLFHPLKQARTKLSRVILETLMIIWNCCGKGQRDKRYIEDFIQEVFFEERFNLKADCQTKGLLEERVSRYYFKKVRGKLLGLSIKCHLWDPIYLLTGKSVTLLFWLTLAIWVKDWSHWNKD